MTQQDSQFGYKLNPPSTAIQWPFIQRDKWHYFLDEIQRTGGFFITEFYTWPFVASHSNLNDYPSPNFIQQHPYPYPHHYLFIFQFPIEEKSNLSKKWEIVRIVTHAHHARIGIFLNYYYNAAATLISSVAKQIILGGPATLMKELIIAKWSFTTHSASFITRITRETIRTFWREIRISLNIYIYIYNENIFFEFSKSKFPRFFCYRNWSTEIHAARERKFYLSFLI